MRLFAQLRNSCVPVLALLAVAGSGHCQTPSFWRFWGTAAGLKEPYTVGMAVDANGVALAKHGSVDSISRLTGYGVESVPDPDAIGRVSVAGDGDIWIFDGTHLRRYRDSRWLSYEIPELKSWPALTRTTDQQWILPSGSPDPLYRLSLCALGGGRVLVLLPDRLLEFDAGSGLTSTIKMASQSPLNRFIDMYRTGGKQIWVSGRNGVGSILETPGSPTLQWQSHAAPAAFRDFEQPREGDGGEVFLAASSSAGKILVRFDGTNWQVVYRGKSNVLRAWRGADSDLWVQDSDQILRLSGSGQQAVDRQEVLSGAVMDVDPDRDGVFWVSTTQGLARYSPPLWRTPAGIRGPETDMLVNSITEDKSGNIWFFSPRFLIGFDGERWTKYPLPTGEQPSSSLTDAIRSLPDGRLAIVSGIPGALLLFDPVRKRFDSVRHPEGRRIRTFLPRRDGGFFIQTVSPGNPSSFRLETFDGHSFHTYLDAGKSWENADLRTICEASNGDIWIGDSSSLGVFRNGKYRSIGRADGFQPDGAFYIYESSPGHILVGGRLEMVEFDGRKWRTLYKGLDRVRNMFRGRDGALWIASGTGAFRYRNGSWIANTTEDGLPSSVVYKVFEDHAGRIWAGTTRGISLFHPESDTEPPRTLLSDDLNPMQSAPEVPVHLMFSGIDKWNVTPPERLLFSYRLDGSSWSEFAEGSSASFRKLAGGTHRFEVRAMDRNGNVDPHPATLAFSVMVPWYRSPEFEYVAVLATFIFAALLAVAAGNYVHRGKLLLQLEGSRRLEQDRKEILELIARREPLETILMRVAQLMAASEPRSACIAAIASETGFNLIGSAGLPVLSNQSRPSIELGPAFCSRVNAAALDKAPFSVPRPSLNPIERGNTWSPSEFTALAGDFRSASTIPVKSGTGEVIGALEVYWPHGVALSESRRNFMEAMAGLAASAIENAHLYRELAYRAQYDSLTHLPNRRHFSERLQEAIDRARGSDQKLALLYLDLDRFKQVNDSLGHCIGDELLKQVAGRLSGCLCKGDMIARMGGDEFMLLLKVRDEHAATEIAVRLLESLNRPVIVAGHELFVSASVGISFFPNDGEDPGTLQKHADSAMYRAKEQGKNRYQCYSREMNVTVCHRLDMDRYLRHALDHGQFELHYQPQMTISGELAGMEALIRLRHPQLGLLGPGDFISIAEESGLILDIGSWVLHETCRQIAAWRNADFRLPKISINVSTLQFAQMDFAQTVARALRRSGVPGSALEIEVTESIVMVQLEESVRQMEKLRALGLTIALDDFGTGYSSLSYLHKLPLDVLKIDRSFVRELDAPSGTLPLVHSIVALAHNLGLCAIAEGVERWSQLDLLKGMGCDLAQGYLLSSPLNAREMESFMANAVEPVILDLSSR